MQDMESRTDRHPLRRWTVAALAIASISGLTILMSAGFASAEDTSAMQTSDGLSGTGSELLGLPLGTAVWALLGLIGLIAGMATVRRSRRRPLVELSAISAMLAEPAVAAA